MDDFICDFLLHSYNRFHLITNIAPYKTMINVSDKEIRKKIQKRRLNTKTITMTYPGGIYLRVSNCIKIID